MVCHGVSLHRFESDWNIRVVSGDQWVLGEPVVMLEH